MSLCVVGAYGLNNRVFDVWTVLFFGILGYIMEKFKYPLPPVILGFILGPIAETNLRRGLMSSSGSFLPFITHPISGVFLAIAVLSMVLTVRNNFKKAKERKAAKGI
jgi:putative tricarboxylic transport membrane protein